MKSARERLVLESNEDDVDVHSPHSDDEECPLCGGTICPPLVDEILKAAENVGTPMSGEDMVSWLRSQ